MIIMKEKSLSMAKTLESMILKNSEEALVSSAKNPFCSMELFLRILSITLKESTLKILKMLRKEQTPLDSLKITNSTLLIKQIKERIRVNKELDLREKSDLREVRSQVDRSRELLLQEQSLRILIFSF